MAEDFIKKKIGPFSGGVWIIVVVGGVGLAILIKKGIGGGGGQPQNLPILVENVPLKGGRDTDRPTPDDPRIPPKEQPKLPPTPRPSRPVPRLPGIPIPPPNIPPKPPVKPPVKPPAPPPAPPAPGTGIRIPGGFPSDCSGVGPVPNGYLETRNRTTARFQDRAIKLSWSVQNIGAGPSGIFAFTQWLSSPFVWPIVNMTRKNRGLRALNENEFKALILDLNAIIMTLAGKENRIRNEQILSIWDKYNTPYLCTSTGSHRGARDMRRTGEA